MDFLQHKLLKRAEEGSLRSLSLFRGIDFWSNDYLGLAQHTREIAGGSTGSRLISGNSVYAEEAEKQIAAFFEAEAGLVFNSGYDANVGLFSSVPQRGDTVVYDELIHASVRDGIRLSAAKSFSFRHNDPADLAQKLSRAAGNKFVAVESLYSMDGDRAPLKKLLQVCKEHSAHFIVDEAHAGGIFGTNGSGLCEQEGIAKDCFTRVVTFGKAYGIHGAIVLGSELLRDYLINFARSFIYTTALPPQQYQYLAGVVHTDHSEAREKLFENIRYFQQLTNAPDFSPIQVVSIPSVNNCQKIAKLLQSEGIAVKAIFPPTVPFSRLRICIHSFNTKEELEQLAKVLGSVISCYSF